MTRMCGVLQDLDLRERAVVRNRIQRALERVLELLFHCRKPPY